MQTTNIHILVIAGNCSCCLCFGPCFATVSVKRRRCQQHTPLPIPTPHQQLTTLELPRSQRVGPAPAKAAERQGTSHEWEG
eukprot:6214541-Pleurochrysis_carterae.AAC.4